MEEQTLLGIIWNAIQAIFHGLLHWITLLGQQLYLHFRRAIAFDMQRIRITPKEETALQARGETDADTMRYLVWRRSLLLITIPLTMCHVYWQIHSSFLFIDQLAGIWTTLGYVVEIIRLLSLIFLAVASVIAVLYWKNFRASTRWLWCGLLLAFLFPILQVAIPTQFAVDWDHLSQEAKQQLKKIAEEKLKEIADSAQVPIEEVIQKGEKRVEGFMKIVRRLVDIAGALLYLVLLLPAICAIFTGVLRACLRIKTLLPESITPGWYLLSVIPLYLLSLLVVFVITSIVFRERQLVLSLALFLVAPLLHLLNIGSLIRPWKAPSRRVVTKIITGVAVTLNLAALVLFFHYIARVQFHMEGKLLSLFGWTTESAMMEYWDLLLWMIDYVGRSLLITVAVADLLLRATIVLWNQAATAKEAGQSDFSEKMLHLGKSFV